MKPPESAKRKVVEEWIAKANADLAVAQRLLQDGDFSNAIAFNCQQAAEKYLKALLTSWDIEFPRTHDLVVLVKLVAAHDAELAARLQDAIVLTPYGVELRYPGDRPDATAAEASEAAELARKVREAILPLLSQE